MINIRPRFMSPAEKVAENRRILESFKKDVEKLKEQISRFQAACDAANEVGRAEFAGHLELCKRFLALHKRRIAECELIQYVNETTIATS